MDLGFYSKGGNSNNYKKMIKVNKNWNVPQKQFTLLQMFVLFEESCVVNGKLSALNVWKRNGYGLGNMCMDGLYLFLHPGYFVCKCDSL